MSIVTISVCSVLMNTRHRKCTHVTLRNTRHGTRSIKGRIWTVINVVIAARHLTITEERQMGINPVDLKDAHDLILAYFRAQGGYC